MTKTFHAMVVRFAVVTTALGGAGVMGCAGETDGEEAAQTEDAIKNKKDVIVVMAGAGRALGVARWEIGGSPEKLKVVARDDKGGQVASFTVLPDKQSATVKFGSGRKLILAKSGAASGDATDAEKALLKAFGDDAGGTTTTAGADPCQKEFNRFLLACAAFGAAPSVGTTIALGYYAGEYDSCLRSHNARSGIFGDPNGRDVNK